MPTMTLRNAALPFDPPPVLHPMPHALLTPRQRQVIHLIAEGLTNKEIASRLGIAVHTVKTHVHAVLTALKLRSRLELAVLVYAGSRTVAVGDASHLD